MDQLKLFEILQKPELYGSKVKSVKVLQTHISFVVLTGEYAYKIKKAVNFGFLDYSTLEKRKHFCEEEVRLNKRLCPDIYLGVVPIRVKNGDIAFNGEGAVVEYAVKMKEFPQDNIMTKLLKQGKIDENVLDKICSILVDFYNSSERSKEIDKYGTVKSIKKNTDENFEQTKPMIDVTISSETYDYIKTVTNNFLDKKKDVFEKRIKNGYIRDCHGDLHSGNIVIREGDVCIFDCIEFNKRFRYSDIASDIGFLAMDLDYLGQPYLSSYLIEKYVEKNSDYGLYDVLNFYKCYRAYVRGKVAGFKLNDSHVNREEKKEAVETAKRYFELAFYYAKLFSRDLEGDTAPILFITSGLTGTGKSTLARKIAVDYHTRLISSDVVRKELAGIDKFERHHDAYNTGLYSPEKMRVTYEKILQKASVFLRNGENVVLDATFKTRDLREKAKEVAVKNGSDFLILYCNCPEDMVKKYLEERVKKKSISDGRWEIYVKQKNSFEPVTPDENVVEVDVSNTSYDYQMKVFMDILRKTTGG